MKSAIWGIADLYEICINRQKNRHHTIIVWSGMPGSGKSTGALKLGRRFKCFKPRKHITYSRKEDMELLELLRYGYIMDDEAIRAAYKRNFQDPEQKTLVQMLNMYRNHYNIFSMCIPKFYNMDKDLRGLVKIHIHVVERGLGVVHIARDDVLYSDDSWDIEYNQKVEKSWAKIKKRNPNFRPPYHKLTTFVGYLKYGPLSAAAESMYEEIKETKRRQVFEQEMMKEMEQGKDKGDRLYESIAKRLLEREQQGKAITRDEFEELCAMNGKAIPTMTVGLNNVLKQMKADRTLSTLIAKQTKAAKKDIAASAPLLLSE